MTDKIDAILFDVGGTLRRGKNRALAEKTALCQPILDLTGVEADLQDFTRMLDEHANAYRKWSRQALAELDETGFWTKWMLPEVDPQKIGSLAVELNRIWRNADRAYEILPDAGETILALFRAGFRLGVVSNTTSSLEAPNLLNELGVSGCIDAIILSCQVGIRKPRPEILLAACQRMGVEPGVCAYIGNLPDRDVASARQAGFGGTVILRDPGKPFPEAPTPETTPDHWIDDLKELLDVFPKPATAGGTSPRPVYQASLSSMWSIGKFSHFNDFFLAARRLGFAGVELNHQVSPAMLAQVEAIQGRVGSIHEPCPAVIAADRLKKEDRLISSPDEGRRQEGVLSIQRSIDLAVSLGVSTIVVHPGQVQLDGALERELRQLVAAGAAHSDRAREVRDQMVESRSRHIEPCLAALTKSLQELLEHAGRHGIRLGLENRYHYYDIPLPDELEMLLSMAGEDRLGFIYDAGHARTLELLGFVQQEAWLERFGKRILGAHLHDVCGVHDHQPPGSGEVDFRRIADHLPREAFRTLEVNHAHSPEQIKTAMEHLVKTGCVTRLE